MATKIVQLWLLFAVVSATAQKAVPQDTVTVAKPKTANLKFNYKQLIIPTVLIGYGVIGINSDQLISFNRQIKEEVQEDIDQKLTIDDFSQYVPAATVYALNLFGVKGKNSIKDQTIIMATSYLIMSTTVLSLKSVIHEERPDGTSDNSFPSGHTATAFSGAEFLWQEYKDVSPWYGVAGYVVATGTGLFRIYNNRHWLTDVAAGAGIGILSTKAAYWLSPFIKDKIFGIKEKNVSSTLVPFYNGKQLGVGFVIQF
jgi:hypothetical protein